MPIKMHNLQPLCRGNSREYNLTFIDSKGEPIPITDWKIYFTVKLSYEDADSQASIKKGITVHDDPDNGKSIIKLLPDDTDIEPSNYWYDIKVKRTAESMITVAMGRFPIIKGVTRRTD